jgi:geranylgeranyl diphosphate synthase type II
MNRADGDKSYDEMLDRDRERINARLEELLPDAGERPESLHQAMRHSTLSGGKRLRGLLCLSAHRLFGDPRPDAALDASCALELLHTYTLIHDDLPSLDDDDVRRGKPSCHVAYGEAVALLAGDALQALAFETLAGCGAAPEDTVRCIGLLARTAGSLFLVGGQVADLEGEGGKPDEDSVAFIHMRKTAELIAASLELGAIIAGAGEARVLEMERIGRNVGLAFQIVDDLLDLEGNEQNVGKGLRKDSKRGKITHPACYGAVRSREIARGLIRESIDGIGRIGDREYLQHLFELILERVS